MNTAMFRSGVAACAVALALSGCAGTLPIADDGTTGDGVQINPPAPPAVIAADGEVLGQGTVLQLDGDAVSFCLGAVAESYPPQCSGPELIGWDWASVDGEESASSVTWGAYAVQGTWDGERMTVTQPPIMLALYDPMVTPDPRRDPANSGKATDAELLELQTEVHELGTVETLASGTENGYLFVSVIHDDGQIQAYFDELYGVDVVVVEPVLRPVTS